MTMSMETLSIDLTTTDDGRTQLFALAGSLDIATSPSLRAALMEAAERPEHAIVVDLTNLEFLDSTGLLDVLHVYASVDAALADDARLVGL